MLHFSVPALDAGFDALPYRFGEAAGHDAPSFRERALWCAVLEQAFVDLSNPTPMNGAGSKTTLRRDAKNFLLRSRDLEAVCELAGISPARLREAARLMESGQLAFYIPPSGKQRSRNHG